MDRPAENADPGAERFADGTEAVACPYIVPRLESPAQLAGEPVRVNTRPGRPERSGDLGQLPRVNGDVDADADDNV